MGITGNLQVSKFKISFFNALPKTKDTLQNEREFFCDFDTFTFASDYEYIFSLIYT